MLGTSYDRAQAALIVGPESLRKVLRYLKEAPGQEYAFLASVHGADYLPKTPRFAVHYELLNMPRVERLRVKCLLEDPGSDVLPEVDSVVDIFPTA